jgi:hypothetical protein
MPTAQELIALYQAGGNKPLTTAQMTGVPSVAPTAPAKTTVTTPTPVVSATDAKSLIQGEIKPTLDNANAQLTEAQRLAKERSIALSQGKITDQASMDAFKKQQEGGSGVTTSTPADQAAQDIANTAEVGYKWAYQRDGTRVQIPINANATTYGMYDTKPMVAPKMGPTGAGMVEEVPLDDGSSYAKMGDGTYGKFTADGTYLGNINADQYENSKVNSDAYQLKKATEKQLEIQTKIDQIINGTYPLSPDQQAQIESVKQTFQRMIDQQVLANKNYEGGVALSQGLLGMSEYSPVLAMGTLKSAIDSGVSKVAELNSKLLDAVSKMNIAFRSDNMEMLQTAYKNYSEYAEKKQAQINKVAEAAAAHEKDIRDYNLEVEKFQEKAYYDDLSAKLASDTLSLNEKKALMEDARARATLSETSRHNLAMELQAQTDTNLKYAELYGNPSGSDTPFAATIDIAKQFGGTNAQRKSIEGDLKKAATSQDWKTFVTQLQNAANSKIGTAQQADILNAQKELAQLSEIESLIKQYQAQNGNMGYLKGTFDQVMTRFGQLSVDPQFKDIANQMTRAFQIYRQNMTGAAFGAQENADYKSVYPSEDNTVDLNLNKIRSAKRFLETNVDAVYRTVLNEGYDNAKNLSKLQGIHEEIATMDDRTAALQAGALVSDDEKFRNLVNTWAKTPWENGKPKDGRDILFFVRQQLGNY